MPRRVLSGCLVGAALIAAAAAAAYAGTYTDDERGFSFEVPDGWAPMPFEQLDAINARVESAYRGSRLLAGYVATTGDPAQAPYFVVQVTRTNLEGLDYDEVAQKLDIEPTRAAADRAQVSSANNIARMQMRRAALDRDNNRFVYQGSAGAPPVANLVRSSVGFLANDGVVTLHCYAKSRDAESVRPVFDAVVSSFRFQEGVGYAEVVQSVSLFGVVGRVVVIGAVLVLAIWFLKDRFSRMAGSGTNRRRRGPHRLFVERYRLR